MTISGTDIFMTRGDSESITVVLDGAVFSPGDTITFTVRPSEEEEIVLQKTVREFSSDGKKAVIPLSPADTEGLDWGKYKYDIQWTHDGGTVTTIVTPSRFKLGKEVTY